MISSQEWKTKNWAQWKLRDCVDCEYNDHNDGSIQIYNHNVPRCTKLDKSIYRCTRKDCKSQAQKLPKSQVEVRVEEPPQESQEPPILKDQGSIGHWFENKKRKALTLENHISKVKEQKEKRKASEEPSISKPNEKEKKKKKLKRVKNRHSHLHESPINKIYCAKCDEEIIENAYWEFTDDDCWILCGQCGGFILEKEETVKQIISGGID